MAEKLWKKNKTPVRTLRVAHEIRDILSDVIRRYRPYEEGVPDFHVTVTDVKVSASLQDAVVFVLPIEKDYIDDVLDYLNRHSVYFKTELAHRMKLKFATNLKFVLDQSFDYADRITELLSKIH